MQTFRRSVLAALAVTVALLARGAATRAAEAGAATTANAAEAGFDESVDAAHP